MSSEGRQFLLHLHSLQPAQTSLMGSMRSCGGAAGRVTILAERHGTPGPLPTFDQALCRIAAFTKPAIRCTREG